MGSAAAAGAQSSAAAAAAAAAGAAGSSDRADTGPYGQVPLQECLQQLWSSEQLLSAKGGRLFNVQQVNMKFGMRTCGWRCQQFVVRLCV
jgi:hypothetical protein